MEWLDPFRFPKAPRATIDFETRATVDLKRVGAWKYAKHKDTRVLCLAFRLPGDEKATVWHAGYMRDLPGKRSEWVPAGIWSGKRKLIDLWRWIKQGGLVEAHNVFFERCIWEHVFMRPTPVDEFGTPDHRSGVGAPEIKEHQWRCSAAKAAAWGLPRALGDACQALLGKELKDAEGRRAMLRLCKPRRARKGESPNWVYWHEDEASFKVLFSYCGRDVDAEHALSEELPDLIPSEYCVWLADMRANWRGVKVDISLCHAAIELDRKVKKEMNTELFALTGISSGTKRKDLKDWLNRHGIPIADTTAATLDWALEQFEGSSLWPVEVQRVLRIAREINRTSIAKFKRILEMVDSDDWRLRELLMYHAATTGRWGGKGVQVQNFPRGEFPEGMTMDYAVMLVMEGDLDRIRKEYGDPLKLLASVARGALIADEGHDLLTADYSAIEARVLFWLAGCETALAIYREGKDLYCDFGSILYRREITKADTKERFFSKTAILSLGFGVGFLTFFLRMRQDMTFTEDEAKAIVGKGWQKYFDYANRAINPELGYFEMLPRYETKAAAAKAFKAAERLAKRYRARIKEHVHVEADDVLHELALCKYVVDRYRGRFPEVKSLWWDTETAVKEAIKEPGTTHEAGRCLWRVERDRLFCQLPSERHMVYNKPYVQDTLLDDGETTAQRIGYWGVAKIGRKEWTRLGTYGASLVENKTQGSARDIMADAFVRADDDYDLIPITSVHDELINGVAEGLWPVRQFEHFMSEAPPAFADCPILAEGGKFKRYRK